MHIDSIEIFRVPREPAALGPRPGEHYESIYVRLTSGEHAGMGEVTLATAPVVSPEWSAGAYACLRDWLAPAVPGRSVDSCEAIAALLERFCGNAAARSAIDLAWWDLSAAVRKTSIHRLLGGRRLSIPVSRTLGVADSPDRLFAEIRGALDAGCDHVTLKVRPGWDVEMLRAVRQEFPSEPIAADCDGLCTLQRQEMFYRLEDFFLTYLEQPLEADDLVGHAMLQENLRTPIALDQSVTSAARAEQAVDLGACRMVRIDLARVGGMTPALAIRKACELAEVPCVVGGGPQGELAAAATAALAGLCDGALAADAFEWQSPAWIAADAAGAPQAGADGKLVLELDPDAPPWGQRIDPLALRAAAVEHVTLGS